MKKYGHQALTMKMGLRFPRKKKKSEFCNTPFSFCRIYGIITSRRIPKPCDARLWTAERTLNHSETGSAVSDQGRLRASRIALWYTIENQEISIRKPPWTRFTDTLPSKNAWCPQNAAQRFYFTRNSGISSAGRIFAERQAAATGQEDDHTLWRKHLPLRWRKL